MENNDLETVGSQLMPEEKAFFDFLDNQLEMVDTFYKGIRPCAAVIHPSNLEPIVNLIVF